MNNNLIDKLKEMTSISSVSGNETEFSLWLKRELIPIAKKVSIDEVGNLIAIKGKPEIYIFSHMDKVGYMVSEKIDGAIRVVAIKKKRDVLEKKWPVTICSKEQIKGLLSLTKDKKYLQINVDQEQLKQIAVGDFVALTPNFKVREKGVVDSQGLDNKLGILAAVETFKRSNNIGLVATVQEESSKLGAKKAVWSLKPKAVIVLDVTYDEGKMIKIGKGPAVCLKDDLLPDKNLLKELLQIATKHNLPFQLEVIESGSSDANVIYDAYGYTPHIFLGIPIKFMHTPKERANLSDLDSTVSLLINLFKKYEQCGS